MTFSDPKKKFEIVSGVLVAVSAFLIFAGWQYFSLREDFKKAEENFALESGELNKKIKDFEITILGFREENKRLNEALYSEQNKNLIFEKQINEIAGTVGVLDKLRQTDPELLQKYSKVYFLNEHYVPRELDSIKIDYLQDKNRSMLIHAKVNPFLDKLMNAALSDGKNLRILSAFRSFYDQESLKGNYKVVYGSGANEFSADQGYSEHQLGTAIDFTSVDHGARFEGFEKTEEYKWLRQNAHKYGFILSYPEDNSYYQFEPWHWRFVGVELASYLYGQGKNFYDVEQRKIDEYLVHIFDN